MKTANVYGFNYYIEHCDELGKLDYRSEQVSRNVVAVTEAQAHEAVVSDVKADYPFAKVVLVGAPTLTLAGALVAEDAHEPLKLSVEVPLSAMPQEHVDEVIAALEASANPAPAGEQNEPAPDGGDNGSSL